MPITLANVELLLPDDDLCRWVEEHIDISDALPWLRADWSGHKLDKATIGVPGYRMPTTFRVNQFFWPQCASRFAYGAFLASTRMANLVRAAANGADGSTTTPIPLSLYVQDQASNEGPLVNVTLQNVVRLSSLEASDFPGGTGTTNNLVLLVVVDARFAWQQFPCPDFGIDPYGLNNPASAKNPDSPNYDPKGTGTVPPPVLWRDCFNACSSALGITLNVDPIPNSYLQPDPSLNAAGMPIGPVLDALCANVGFRFVANFDGSFNAQNYTNAYYARTADDQGSAGPLRTLRGGGDQFVGTI